MGVFLKINNIEFFVKSEVSILDACKYLGISVPRFCYHELLSIAGNCRMCLVEIENLEKPVASCVTEVEENMSIWLNTPFVKKARENVLETLLLNHPLDCPICDQAGECDLQDQTKIYGSANSRYFFNKRGVEEKNCGPLIKTIMTRCIHCTRCVRYCSEILGSDILGTLNRGTHTEVGGYISKLFLSELSGNIIDLCPVGALTSKPYAFKARPWELRVGESVDLSDSLGSNIYINFKETEIFRILPKTNTKINGNIISDKARFSYDAIKLNRLQTLFLNDQKGIGSTLTTWIDFFRYFDKLKKKSSRVQFIVDEELDFEALVILKKISFLYPKKIIINTIKAELEETNFFMYKSKNTVVDIEYTTQICFLFSTNIKLENAIINAKIRHKYRNDFLTIISSGLSFSSNLSTFFINLSITNVINILEGKNKIVCKLLIEAVSPLFLFGAGFYKKFTKHIFLINFINKIFPTAKILIVQNFCNSSAIGLLNIYSLSRRSIDLSCSIFAINLDDNILSRRVLINQKKDLIWLNSHGSPIATQSHFIIPVALSFETGGTFLNLEHRPQNISPAMLQKNETFSVMQVLSAMFQKEINIFKNAAFGFLKEAANKILFDNFRTLFFYPKHGSTFYKNFNSYPLKPSISDFYCSNKITKQSAIMNQCSQEVKRLDNNFIK